MGTNSSDIYVVIISVSVILLLLLSFTVSFILIYSNRQARLQLEMKMLKEKYDQEILKTQLEIKEQTLKNISQEIHDNVGQVLSLAILNLSAIELYNNESAGKKIEQITNLVEKAVADLRNLSKTMDSEIIADSGLVAVVGLELEMLEKTGVFETSLTIIGIEKRLEVTKEIITYRIIQESINNIIKHSKAAKVDVLIIYSEEEVRITISDNGVGFDNNRLQEKDINKKGAGLKNMKSRADLINASFDVKSIILKGTTITIKAPFALT